jgi:hypothetical protein
LKEVNGQSLFALITTRLDDAHRAGSRPAFVAFDWFLICSWVGPAVSSFRAQFLLFFRLIVRASDRGYEVAGLASSPYHLVSLLALASVPAFPPSVLLFHSLFIGSILSVLR